MYPGNVTVSVTDIDILQNAVVNGNLIIIGTPKDSLLFSNITVGGDLDLSTVDGDLFNFDGITVTGNTIL